MEAFSRLVEAFRRPVLSVIHRVVGRRGAADVEDLAQEVFVRAYRARGGYEPQAKFTTWLFRIATNLCLNYIRDSRRRQAQSLSGDSRVGIREPADDDPEGPESAASRRELQEAVRTALERLPDSQRIATVYARYHEMSLEQIAEVMGLTPKAVKSLLFRARENLRRLLQPHIHKHLDVRS